MKAISSRRYLEVAALAAFLMLDVHLVHKNACTRFAFFYFVMFYSIQDINDVYVGSSFRNWYVVHSLKGSCCTIVTHARGVCESSFNLSGLSDKNVFDFTLTCVRLRVRETKRYCEKEEYPFISMEWFGVGGSEGLFEHGTISR